MVTDTVDKKEKITFSEAIAALPQTFASGISAFVGSWFAIEEYISIMPFAKRLRDQKGKKLIFDNLDFMDDIKSIVRRWKTNAGAAPAGTDRSRTLREAIYTMDEVATKYGLHDEAAFLRDWSAKNDRLLENGEGKLLDSRKVIHREELLTALGEVKEKYPFFGLFHEALGGLNDPTLGRTSKSLEKLEAERKVYAFSRAQHTSVLNLYRVPITVALTVAAMASVGIAYIRDRQKEKSFTERLALTQSKVAALEKAQPAQVSR